MFGVTFLFDCVIHYNTPEAFLTLCWIYNYYGTWLTILQTFSSYFPKSYKVEVVLATILFVFRLKFILFLANLAAICETSEEGKGWGGKECLTND